MFLEAIVFFSHGFSFIRRRSELRKRAAVNICIRLVIVIGLMITYTYIFVFLFKYNKTEDTTKHGAYKLNIVLKIKL